MVDRVLSPSCRTEWFSFSPFCMGAQDIFYLGKSQVTICYLYKVKISGLNTCLFFGSYSLMIPKQLI